MRTPKLLFYLFLISLGGARVTAQESLPVEPPTSSPDDVSTEGIQQRIREIEAATDLDEKAKAELLKTCHDALEQLRIADEASRASADLEARRNAAPDELAKIKAELAQPSVAVKPDIPADASLQQLEQLLAQQEAELKAVRDELTLLEEERKRRTDRRARLPEETAAMKNNLDEIQRQLAAPDLPEEKPRIVQARRTLLLARQRAVKQTLDKFEKEVLSYDARGELLTARRDLASRRAAEREELVKAWRQAVSERRRTETDRAEREASRKRREAALLDRVVKEIADENVSIAGRRAKENLPDQIDRATKDFERISTEATLVRDRFKDLRSKIEQAGLTKALGLKLRTELDRLGSVAEYERQQRRRQEQLSNVVVQRLEAQDERDALSNLEPRVREAMARVASRTSEAERNEIEAAIRDLLQARRENLTALANDYETLFNKLTELDTAERLLIKQIEAYSAYLRENVLWVPSALPPRGSDFGRLADALAWLLNPSSWGEMIRGLGGTGRTYPIRMAWFPILFVALLMVQRRIRTELRRAGEAAEGARTYAIKPTFRAILLTVLMVIPWPALLAFVGWCVAATTDPTEFAQAIGAGAKGCALVYALLEGIRQLCRPRGLGESHFGWSPGAVRVLRLNLLWLLPVAVPCSFLVFAIESSGNEDHQATLGRLAYVVGQVAVALFVQRIIRPEGGVVQEVIRRSPGGWWDRLRFVWYPAGVLLPVALGITALWGYYYTALGLTLRLQATIQFILLVVIVNALFLRWILMARRRLAMEQYRKKRATAQAEAAKSVEPGGEAPVEVPEPQIDLSALSAQTRNLLRSAVMVSVAVGLWWIWVDVLPALGVLDSVQLWSTTAVAKVASPEGGAGVTETAVPVTLADLLMAIVIAALTFIAAKNVPGLMEIMILQRLPLDAGSRYATTTISRYLITIVGLVFAFGAIGISWSTIQWLAAAITVGLGFGLQEIFANFVSGLILLFERPIRVGDIITVGTTDGTVTRIQMRATTIMDWNRKEIVIPNKEFVTGQIVNWSLTDRVLRLVLPVGIAYGSDTRKATDIMLRAAADHSRVLAQPEPRALFVGFGASSLDFELRVFLKDIDDLLNVRHELLTSIDDRFRQAGIEIPFPQRDLHVRSIRAALHVERSDDSPPRELQGESFENR